MRRFLCSLLTLSLFLLVGCTQEAPQVEVPANFYYCAQEISFHNKQGVFQYEQREAKDVIDDYAALMNLYFAGPVGEHLVSPFPNGISVKDITVNGDNVTITLNDALATLTDIHLTKACTCIALTLLDLTQANTVSIHAPVPRFGDSQILILSHQDLSLIDIGVQNSQ